MQLWDQWSPPGYLPKGRDLLKGDAVVGTLTRRIGTCQAGSGPIRPPAVSAPGEDAFTDKPL